MENLFGAPFWTFVGVALTFLTVLVMIVIFFIQRIKKKLSYEITSNTQLLGVKGEIKGKVKILYDGNEVENVHLLSLKFTNNGNQPIATDDFERPLYINLNSEATILTFEIIDENPTNLNTSIRLNKNTLSISPLLLNSKDSFTVKTLVSDLIGFPTIDGRIVGVKSISQYHERQYPFLIFIFIQSIIMFIYARYFDNGDSQGIFNTPATTYLLSIIVLLLIILAVVIIVRGIMGKKSVILI